MAELLSGAAIAIFAFGLAWLRDTFRSEREASQRDSAVVGAAKAEIRALIRTIQDNQNLVHKELSDLREGKPFLLNPLNPVGSGFWDLVKANPPRGLLRDPQTLARVREVASRADQVREMIRSRESFRISHSAAGVQPGEFADQLRNTMVQYDELIDTFQSQLRDALTELYPEIEAARPQGSLLKRLLPGG